MITITQMLQLTHQIQVSETSLLVVLGVAAQEEVKPSYSKAVVALQVQEALNSKVRASIWLKF